MIDATIKRITDDFSSEFQNFRIISTFFFGSHCKIKLHFFSIYIAIKIHQ